MTSTFARLRWLPLVAVLVGCAHDRPGTWQPTGANNTNLQAMIADPAHLDRGVGASTDRGAAGADATTRLLEGRRRALPITQTTRTAFGGPATGAGAGATGGGGR